MQQSSKKSRRDGRVRSSRNRKRGDRKPSALGDTKQGTCIARFSGIPYSVEAVPVIGTGLVAYDATIIGVSSAFILPSSLGGRLAAHAALYQRWRLKKGSLKYIPTTSLSGTTESAGTVTPGYAVNQFVMGVTLDPALFAASVPTYGSLVEYGCKPFRSVNSCTVSIPPSRQWLYTTPLDTTNADLRLSIAGILLFAADAFFTPTSGTVPYGNIYLDFEVEFSSPLGPTDDVPSWTESLVQGASAPGNAAYRSAHRYAVSQLVAGSSEQKTSAAPVKQAGVSGAIFGEAPTGKIVANSNDVTASANSNAGSSMASLAPVGGNPPPAQSSLGRLFGLATT